MNATKATPEMRIQIGTKGLLWSPPEMATVEASKIHAATSLKAAVAMAVSPTWVVRSLSSANMRARTGKAVMERATPMNMRS